MRLILILSSLALAGSVDSLAISRFRADSTQAESLIRQAAHSDSVAWQMRISARVMFDLAVRNLQRDTAKAPAK
jgi:hypothetical protein